MTHSYGSWVNPRLILVFESRVLTTNSSTSNYSKHDTPGTKGGGGPEQPFPFHPKISFVPLNTPASRAITAAL